MISEQIFLPIEDNSDVMDENEGNSIDFNDYTPESLDEYLAAQVILPISESYQTGEVIHWKRDHNGCPIGTRNDNPILEKREYEVIFPDGTIQSYLANTITENIYSQVDDKGHSFSILSEIIGHEWDDSTTHAESTCHTTKGW